MLAQVALRAGAKAAHLCPGLGGAHPSDGKRRVVYVERADGAFESREVQTGQNRNGRVVIVQGLTAGERIVGARRLAARHPGRAAALNHAPLLIAKPAFTAGLRRLFATFVVAAFGLRAYLDTPIEAYPDVTNTQVTVITQLPGNASGGDRAAHHGAARAGAERDPGDDIDAQRKPVRPVLDHPDLHGRHGQLSRSNRGLANGSLPPIFPRA